MVISIDATGDSCVKPLIPCTHFSQRQKLFGSKLHAKNPTTQTETDSLEGETTIMQENC